MPSTKTRLEFRKEKWWLPGFWFPTRFSAAVGGDAGIQRRPEGFKPENGFACLGCPRMSPSGFNATSMSIRTLPERWSAYRSVAPAPIPAGLEFRPAAGSSSVIDLSRRSAAA